MVLSIKHCFPSRSCVKRLLTPPPPHTDPLIYLQHAASLSHTESQIRLANHLLKSNPIEAIKLYEESESNEGYFNLGHIYWKGVEGVEKDEDQAVIYFEKGEKEKLNSSFASL